MYTRSKKDAGPKKPLAISYWAKEKIRCPACRHNFPREEMFTGSGRLSAGELTEELHRKYVPTARYGKINPLIYAVGACPNCHGATVIVIEHDFDVIQNADYIIDLGPGGGTHGGQIIATGTPREICRCKESLTGKYLERYAHGQGR